ncbi:MAG: S24/S26 family peptidase [Planctomycetota bacterium]
MLVVSGAVVVVLAFALVVCRASFGWFFPVASGSMEPTIKTGEIVFLRYDDGVPDRYDIVAFTDVGGGASVKRVLGLPNEAIVIEPTGDVRIEGRLLRDDPQRPGLIPIFDSRLQSIGEHWRHGGTLVDPWSLVDGAEPGPDEVWAMDGSAVGRGAALGLLALHDRVDDGRLLPCGERVAGNHTVHDVAVAFEVRVLEPGGRLRVQLVEQGDVFEASAPVYAGELDSRVDVFRTTPDGIDYLDYGRATIPLGEWIPVRFSNVDDRLELEIGDARMSVEYDRNSPHPSSRTTEPVSLGERVRLGGEGIVMQVRSILVERDLHVVPRGSFGVGRTLLLGPDEIYVVGDASSSSRDSRDRGPVELDRVFGRVEAVVWPLDGFRRVP